ncbi:MAG: TIGR03862 family flavoprotein [Rubrivivax sp.]|nr:TIGR03862 family flavoprotein [Rubrivivax sp.]
MSTAALPTALPGVAVIGGGPAGLMAAEALLAQGVPVDLFDAMPSVGRKFLLAGKGGLNLTHAEPFAPFVARYAERAPQLQPLLARLGADELRAWAQGLGISTFVGSSMRVFPQEMKAAPLLRAWLHLLRGQGLRVHVRHRWLGWSAEGACRWATPQGEREQTAGATVLALGGGSWPQLGSDGAWVPVLRQAGAPVGDLVPSNCGFDGPGWSEHLASRFAGAPLKTVALRWADAQGRTQHRRGEAVLTQGGVEGGLVYAASADLRRTIARDGEVTVHWDLLPDRDTAAVLQDVLHPRGSRSMSSHLQSRLKLAGVKMALLRELAPAAAWAQPEALAAFIKALPMRLLRPRPLAEAISSAGGLHFEGLTPELMLRARPGVFACGEMLDWEAPTGGYLLTACFSTGRQAGESAARWWQAQNEASHRVPAADAPAPG